MQRPGCEVWKHPLPLKKTTPGASWPTGRAAGTRTTRTMERACARIMRVRIAYPAGHQRPAAPVHAFNHGLKPRRADRQRDTSTPPPAAAAGRWLRRDPQLLRNRQGRPVLACSQRSRHPRRLGSWTPGPADSWRCHLNAGRAGRGRTPAGQMNTPAPRAPAPVRSGQCGQSVGRPLAADPARLAGAGCVVCVHCAGSFTLF